LYVLNNYVFGIGAIRVVIRVDIVGCVFVVGINYRFDVIIVTACVVEIRKEFGCGWIDIVWRAVAPVIGNDENEHN
jgi:hypothetical protein